MAPPTESLSKSAPLVPPPPDHDPPFGTSSLSAADTRVDIANELLNANVQLDPRSYDSEAFARQLLSIFIILQVPGWDRTPLNPNSVSVCRASGSFMNYVYIVSAPSVPTVLLRVYGSSTDSIVLRSRELYTLHVLSSRYHIGPRIYGTFTNGRIEEYIDSITLTSLDIRDKTTSRWIGARMAELHSINISAIDGEDEQNMEIDAEKNVKRWAQLAREVLAHPDVNEEDRAALDMDNFTQHWTRYMHWISRVEKVEDPSRRVFAHNDIHGGNLLKVNRKLPKGTPEHHQIVMVDFEYAGPNPRALDIANHFQEWTADYQSSAPHVLDPSRYPTFEERYNFYEAYLSHAGTTNSVDDREASIIRLEREVHIWRPACNAVWAVCNIVMDKDQVEQGLAEGDFDYNIGAAKYRMAAFFHGLEAVLSSN
ncbi:kinase-like domain-containing protein [Scleroderma yunnanense]